jgi:hypothetical protein
VEYTEVGKILLRESAPILEEGMDPSVELPRVRLSDEVWAQIKDGAYTQEITKALGKIICNSIKTTGTGCVKGTAVPMSALKYMSEEYLQTLKYIPEVLINRYPNDVPIVHEIRVDEVNHVVYVNEELWIKYLGGDFDGDLVFGYDMKLLRKYRISRDSIFFFSKEADRNMYMKSNKRNDGGKNATPFKYTGSEEDKWFTALGRAIYGDNLIGINHSAAKTALIAADMMYNLTIKTKSYLANQLTIKYVQPAIDSHKYEVLPVQAEEEVILSDLEAKIDKMGHYKKVMGAKEAYKLVAGIKKSKYNEGVPGLKKKLLTRTSKIADAKFMDFRHYAMLEVRTGSDTVSKISNAVRLASQKIKMMWDESK